MKSSGKVTFLSL